MAITINKRPYSICFSGNPVHYELYSGLAAGNSEVFFEIRLMFKNVSGTYTPTESLPYSPVNGLAEIDVQDILEGLLEFELPKFSIEEKDTWTAEKQTGFFYLQYREITPTNADPTWDDSEVTYESLVVKGGLSRFKYQGNNYWVNYYNAPTPEAERPFLSWQKNGRMAAITERMYLAYLLIDDVSTLKAVAKVTYVDGSTDISTEIDLPIVKNRIVYIPVGAFQLELEALNTSKIIWHWEIRVKEAGNLSEAFRFYNDQRQDYNDITLNYRNSVGGLDSVRIRGVVNVDLDYEYQEQAKTVRPDYFDGHFYDPQKIVTNNRELVTYRGDIGHLDKEEQDRLRDAFIKREVWMEQGKKWLPVNILTKSIRQKSSEFGNSRWHLPIDFALAHDGDYYYTPEFVNVGSGSFTSNVCAAKLSPMTVDVDITTDPVDAIITLNGTEDDPQNASTHFQWRLYDGTTPVTNWETKSYSDLPFTFTMPKDEVYTLKTRAICANNVYGKEVSVPVNTNDIVLPPGDPTPASNSQIVNNTGWPLQVEIKLAGSTVADVLVGANNTYFLYLPDNADIEVTVGITNGVNPSEIILESDLVTYSGNTGMSTWVFRHVNLFGGAIITIY